MFTNFQQDNLGSKYGVARAVDWFFKNEEEGIILEHDCLPSQSFFLFCDKLLAYYRNDYRIMHISGCNLQSGQKRGEASYYFSQISSIWGWASWRRVWNLYDVDMQQFQVFEKENRMINIFPDKKTADWVTNMAREVYLNKIMSWDYPLGFSILINHGLCITPNINLVSNIGFGDKAIHTKDISSPHSNIPLGEMLNIVHPSFLIPDVEADLYQLSLSMPKATSLKSESLFNRAFARIKNRV